MADRGDGDAAVSGVEHVVDMAAERTKRELAIEASRPLADALRDDGRMVVPPELQVTEPGVYTHMSHDVYHADPVPGGSLSRGGARLLLPPSCPALFEWNLMHPPPPKPVFDLGIAAHHLVLGVGPELVHVPFDNYSPTGTGNKTKAIAMRDEAHARRAVPLTNPQWEKVHGMAEALRQHPEASALLDPARGGKPEQAMFWIDEATEVWRRSLVDWLPPVPPKGRRMIVPDYKTAESAYQETWVKSAADHGYDMQAAWIKEAVGALFGVEVQVVFILQEKVKPYLVSIAWLDAKAEERGRQRNARALELYRECKESGVWPGYETIKQVDLPQWAYYEE